MENIQKQLTDKLLSSDLTRYPASLFHGKMGLSFYFYQLALHTSIFQTTYWNNQYAVFSTVSKLSTG